MKIKFKSVLLVIIAFMLFLTGCQVDKTYTVEKYELKNDVYVQNISNDVLTVDISDGITVNSKTKLSFFKDEDLKNEVTETVVELVDGDNFYYAVLTFKDKSTETLKLNLYHLRMFKVEFNSLCGVKVDSQIVEENSLAKKPDVKLTKYGYGFKGWDYNFKRPITKDLVIDAKWVPNSFTITYDTKGGEVESLDTFVTYGEPYFLETPTKEGYEFVGWFYNGKKIDSEVWNLDGDITIEAHWEEETVTYEIDYIIVGCVGSHLQRTYTNKEEVVLRTPYKNGYRFRGWYFTGDFSDERVYVLPKGTKGNLTLYSKWEWFDIKKANISILGDSISTFYDKNSPMNSNYSGNDEYYYPKYSPDVKSVNDTWWYQVIEQTKGKFLTNDSLSGSSCYNNGSESCTPQATMNNARIKNLKGSDIVIINIGTNDIINGHSAKDFEESYRTMLTRIKETCPDVFIFCCTLGYCSYKDYNDKTRLEFNEIIKKVTADFDSALIDFAKVQTKDNVNQMVGTGVHPTKEGMKVLSNQAVKSISEYININ